MCKRGPFYPYMMTALPRAIVLSLALSFSLPAIALSQDDQTPIPSTAAGAPVRVEKPLEPAIPTVKELFKASLGDFKELPTSSNLRVLGAGLAASSAFLASDAVFSRTLSSARWTHGTFDATGLTGQFPLHIAAGLATYGLGRASASPRLAGFGADLIRAQLLAQATTQAIKFAVNRTRPDGTLRSFPSGHTSTMFATATVFQRHFGWKAGVPAYAAATWVAAGRIQGRRHYLTDVAVGAALGIVAGRTVTVGRGRTRFSVAPMATAGGAGIGFTLVK